MDELGELVGADRGNLDGKEPYLRVAVRDGRLVPDQPSARRALSPRHRMGRIDDMKRQADKVLNQKVALGGRMARLIDDAKRTGCADFAEQLEDCFTAFLRALPKAQKRAVLISAYDAIINPEAAENAKLSVVAPIEPRPR
ncbi:MAG: hypothetical protein ACKVP5_11240 [Aestuariivirga sp.]